MQRQDADPHGKTRRYGDRYENRLDWLRDGRQERRKMKGLEWYSNQASENGSARCKLLSEKLSVTMLVRTSQSSARPSTVAVTRKSSLGQYDSLPAISRQKSICTKFPVEASIRIMLLSSEDIKTNNPSEEKMQCSRGASRGCDNRWQISPLRGHQTVHSVLLSFKPITRCVSAGDNEKSDQ